MQEKEREDATPVPFLLNRPLISAHYMQLELEPIIYIKKHYKKQKVTIKETATTATAIQRNEKEHTQKIISLRENRI